VINSGAELAQWLPSVATNANATTVVPLTPEVFTSELLNGWCAEAFA